MSLLQQTLILQLQGEATIAARRATAINSSAYAHNAHSAKCKRVGSCWVPMEYQEVPIELNYTLKVSFQNKPELQWRQYI